MKGPHELYHQVMFHRAHRNLRWVSFPSGRPWLPPGGVDLTMEIAFVDRRHQLSALHFTTASGTPVHHQTSALVDLSAPMLRFNAEPDDAKSFFATELRYEKPEPIVCTADDDPSPLFSLIPTVVHPSFIFDIKHLAEQQFDGITLSTLVETGTLFAHTALHASHWFDRVISIELDPTLHASATALVLDGVEFVLGDSGVALPVVASGLTEPAMFFLDAHWSGDASVNWETSRFRGFPVDTAHTGDAADAPTSQQQVPLTEELDAILHRFAPAAVIVIDDWQSIGEKDLAFRGEDWTHLSKAQILETFRTASRTRFMYPFDDKHYVIGLNPI